MKKKLALIFLSLGRDVEEDFLRESKEIQICRVECKRNNLVPCIWSVLEQIWENKTKKNVLKYLLRD